MSRILLIEDDAALRNSVSKILERSGYDVQVSADGAAGVRELQSTAFDVVLLDIGLPFVDGWRILGTLEGKRLPAVIVISARGEERDKVRALDLGADDYLAKPFGADELLARIRVVLRRAQPSPGPSRSVRAGSVTIDLAGQSVVRDGVEVRLSPTEYGLLSVLAQHAGQVMDHRTLLRTVWGPTYGDERNYLRTFVQRLRAKLEADPAHPEIIVTVGARGYRFGPPSIA
ncbi:MAG: two-component system, OmpR family, operon response regulator KdpE [Chloroflexota bacterium]|nr:two-component system, OmpR family, operon response regulator KdpE [Chloroflexota bacterium]